MRMCHVTACHGPPARPAPRPWPLSCPFCKCFLSSLKAPHKLRFQGLLCSFPRCPSCKIKAHVDALLLVFLWLTGVAGICSKQELGGVVGKCLAFLVYTSTDVPKTHLCASCFRRMLGKGKRRSKGSCDITGAACEAQRGALQWEPAQRLQ